MDGNLPIKRGREGNEGWSVPEADKRFRVSGDGGRSVSRSSSSSSQAEYSNPFHSLSDEVIDLIFQFLPRRDLATRVVCVDKRFYSVVQGDLGTLAHQGREAYARGDYIEAARCFSSVLIQEVEASNDENEIDGGVGGTSGSCSQSGLQRDFSQCLVQLKFLDIPALNRLSDEEIQSMSHSEMRALWIEHVEPQMEVLTQKTKANLQHDLYQWSCQAATGAWGDDSVSPEERVYCCERLIFLLLYSQSEAVRKDAMLALVRVAREMKGNGAVEQMLVDRSIGRVVDFMSRSGGIESMGGIAKIVFENLKRQDCSFIAKKALLSALGRSLSSVSDELKTLVERRAVIKSQMDAMLAGDADAIELKQVEAGLEQRKEVAAEIDRLNRDRQAIMGPFGRTLEDDVTVESIEERLGAAHSRLGSLQGGALEINQLITNRRELQEVVWMGAADEADEQALALVEARLDELLPVRSELDSLKKEIKNCKDDLIVLKIDDRLKQLSEDVQVIETLKDRKAQLDGIVKEKVRNEDLYQDLLEVDARILTLDAFVRGFIRNVSTELAMESLASPDDSGLELRDMLMKFVSELALSHAEDRKIFSDVLKLFSYIIGGSESTVTSECLSMGLMALDLELAHPSHDRAQRINEWLFSIGIQDLRYPDGSWVEDKFIVTSLERITGDDGQLTQPVPLARIGRLAEALGAPCIKDETRWRIYGLIQPQIERLVKNGVRNPEVLHIFKTLSDSMQVCLGEIAESRSNLDLQRDMYEFLYTLSETIPGDWEVILKVVVDTKDNVPDLVRNALTAPVLGLDE